MARPAKQLTLLRRTPEEARACRERGVLGWKEVAVFRALAANAAQDRAVLESMSPFARPTAKPDVTWISMTVQISEASVRSALDALSVAGFVRWSLPPETVAPERGSAPSFQASVGLV